MEDQKSALVLDDLVLINQLEEQMLNKLLEYSHLQKVLEAKKWKINIKINPNPKSHGFDDKKLKYEAQSESIDPISKCETQIKEEYFSDYEQEPQGDLVVNLKMLDREGGSGCGIDTVQVFFVQAGHDTIYTSSGNKVIYRANKNWTHFYKIKNFQNQTLKNIWFNVQLAQILN